MSFNSFEFALFLPVVFFIYWALKEKLNIQNLFIVGVSYLFYGWWDWRFLILIFISSLSSYLTALCIQNNDRRKSRLWLILNITLNLGILCVFKYFNFFGDNLLKLFQLFGIQIDWITVDILLPIGISFYTFQAISYSVDVYKRKISATNNIIAFLAYIAFFPQLVAGPIEKASTLLPQFLHKRRFDYYMAVTGMRQILWGLVKKIVIADSCAIYVDRIFNSPDYYSSSTLVLGLILFSFQAYGDFSGYSDIAIGCGKILGIKLTPNFKYPYFSRNFGEYWRHWHMSLMSWFKDYVYIPLGGSRKGLARKILNIIIVFLLSGIWHGANWNFVVWGLFNGVLLSFFILINQPRPSGIAVLKDIPAITGTYILTLFALIIFRNDTLEGAWHYFTNIFTQSFFEIPSGLTPLPYIAIFMLIEWLGRRNEFAIEYIPVKSSIVRWGFYWVLLFAIAFTNNVESQQFIYFQF